MAKKKKPAKSKRADSVPFNYGVPPEVLAVARSEVMDFTGVSLFCRRQAQCATLFNSIVEVEPGMFVLKSPFKESFIRSLHCWALPNSSFTPEEIVAYALLRHSQWCLSVLDIDAVRNKAGAEQIKPRSLRGAMDWIQGIVKPTGEFTRDAEAEGKPAILFWQEYPGSPPNFAIEICGPGVASQEPTFRRTLLESMVDCLTVELKLKRPSVGRPHLATQAESAAYHRDHLRTGRAQIAKLLCSCGNSQHAQKCFDRLNKLADNFYRTQRSMFGKLVKEQKRKYPAIFS